MKKFKLTLVLLFCSFHMAFAQNLQNGLVAYYPFNGNANDESGNGNNGAVGGSTLAFDRFGNPNSAYEFDGVDDIITISPGNFNFGTGDFTISAWIKANSAATIGRIFADRVNCNAGQGGLALWIRTDGTIAADACRSGGGSAAFSVTNVLGNWFHIVSKRQLSTLNVYINGNLENTTSSSRNVDNTSPAEIGGTVEFGAQDNFFDGAIDDIRVYNRALSDLEIQVLFEGGVSLETGLVASFPFNGNANDESGNGHNGTEMGASLTIDRFNCPNSAYSFDGVDDVISIPTSPALRSGVYSVSIWLQTTQVPVDQVVPFSGQYHQSGVSGNGYQLEINQLGNIGVDQFTRPTVNHGGGASSGPVNDGIWHHVVAIWDGTTTSVYIDGVLGGTQITPCCSGALPGPIRWTSPPQDFTIGFSSDPLQVSFSEYYAGKIDDITIYNRVLSAAEISSLFNLVQPICNSNPLAKAGPDQTIECTSPQGSVVTLDGSNSSDPDNDPLTYTWRENGAIIAGPTTSPTSPVTLDLGSHTIELMVDDGNGGTDTDDVVIQVEDTTPPTIEVSVSHVVLWPPNHNYSSIDIAQYVTGVSDNCAVLSTSDVVITQVSSDEEEDAKGGGDGNTKSDMVITYCSTVDLRAERQGSGNGRVYTISLELDDGSGNIANASLQVQVPQSQNGNPAVDDGAVYTVNGNCNGIPKFAIFDDKVAVNETLPEGYALNQNYPNPFNPSTMISFEVPEAAVVRMAIYNLKGQLIRTLYSGPIGAGYHRMIWEGTNSYGAVVASGAYIYSLEAKDFKISRKLIFIR